MKIESEKHRFYCGLSKKFQGLGFTFNTDNPLFGEDYWVIEMRLFWFKMWYTYTFKK